MAFAVRVAHMAAHLPRSPAGRAAAFQIVRSASSVAANYRASQRAKSRPDFIAKITTVLEEADESEFWLQYIVETHLLSESRMAALRKEAGELVCIIAAIRRNARRRGD